jgi:hypothetical protein
VLTGSTAVRVAVLAALLWCASAAPADTGIGFVWWEGEDAAETNFAHGTEFDASTLEGAQAGSLSGGDWFTHRAARPVPDCLRWDRSGWVTTNAVRRRCDIAEADARFEEQGGPKVTCSVRKVNSATPAPPARAE